MASAGIEPEFNLRISIVLTNKTPNVLVGLEVVTFKLVIISVIHCLPLPVQSHGELEPIPAVVGGGNRGDAP